ncbi:MAG: outer membrane beta-barrel protein [Ginsengibacter sp.]
MKKIVLAVAGCFLLSYAFSQDVPGNTVSSPKNLKLPNRAADHFMLQLSSDHWSGTPDSISSHQNGFSRGFNAYLMFDKPFKTAPKLSLGIGLGISTSNIFFKRMDVNLKAGGTVLPFTAVDSTFHFKKYKMATGFLEVPLEFRYMAKPLTPNKSFKAAVGLKFGTMVNAHTKGKTLQDKNNNTANNYALKEIDRRLLNSTRFMGTARFGYGIFSFFGSYQLNKLLKDGAGADMHLYQVGLTLSGL